MTAQKKVLNRLSGQQGVLKWETNKKTQQKRNRKGKREKRRGKNTIEDKKNPGTKKKEVEIEKAKKQTKN